ncbi:hypothetical protein P154DRAFT_192303 [Amniculicola lignicola CBS 123094]|uniref:Uncharacterized protein n=1 Tax=Amniculicola lignicola CBS 123094 TaxID=1392246 RepID=A0A6A5WHZ1_9PLEO|nr:hypothetical protein P154DRAFT_192303 [Amniculicola lignicola CBS 123094]
MPSAMSRRLPNFPDVFSILSAGLFGALLLGVASLRLDCRDQGVKPNCLIQIV